jgi:hypothetical protein
MSSKEEMKTVEPSPNEPVVLGGSNVRSPTSSLPADPFKHWEHIFSLHFSPEDSTKYAKAFVHHAIPMQSRFTLSTEEMQELGILIGHRRSIKAILLEEGNKATTAQPLTEETSLELRNDSILSPGLKAKAGAAFVALPPNEVGCKWVRMSNSKELQENFPKLGFDKSFLRCFTDRKQMPMLLTKELDGGGWSAAVVLRIPEAKEDLENGDTIASLTTRFVVLVKMNGKEGTVLTYHRRDLSEMNALADRWSPMSGAYDGSLARASAADLLVEVLKIAIRDFGVTIENLRDVADEVESEQDLALSVTKLSLLQRQSGVFSQCLLGIIGVLEQLAEDEFAEQQGVDVDELKQKAKQYHASADECHDNALASVQLKIAVDGFRSGENMKFFTAMSFVLQPIGTITGWYGMNFDNMPDLHYENSYFVLIGIVAGLVILITVGLIIKS